MDSSSPDGIARSQESADESGATEAHSRRRLLRNAAGILAIAALTVRAVHRAAADNDGDDDDSDESSGQGRGRGRGRGGEDRDDDDREDDVPRIEAPIPPGAGVITIVDDDNFTPSTLAIDAGQSITFVNLDGDDHTATGSAFDTGIIPEGGGTATVTLDAPGIYPFACLIHPVMVGEIRVRDENGNVPARAAASPVPVDAVAVSIIDLAFTPASVTVGVSETGSWTNDDSVPHTVTADDGTFDSGILDSGSQFSWTFTTAGTLAYQCDLHPSMQGEVVVTDDGLATPTGDTASATSEARVAIVDSAFKPPLLTATAGASVVWTNDGDAPHTVTSDNFGSDLLDPGDDFQHTFTDTGTFDYVCAIHPSMMGRIEVEPA